MMVMELLPTSLTQCLERHQQIPGSLKASILYDVSLGLQYLHTRSPPIIHRDLTTNNVLLTSSMNAKLADLGVARIINLNPAQLTARMTQCPGTPSYMPPEALSDQPQYDEKLDVFSFGNLILHVSTQQWPIPAAFLTYDPRNPGVPKVLTEIQRRQKYLDLVDEKNPLKRIALQCLQNFPDQRPITANIAFELEQIYKSNASYLPAYLELVAKNKRVGEENVQLHQMLQSDVREKDEIHTENQRLGEENAELRLHIVVLEQEVERLVKINVQPKSVSLPPPKRYSQPMHTIRCKGRPYRVAVTADGDVVVTMDHCVAVYNKDGSEIRSFGSRGSNVGQLKWPDGVAVTPDSDVLVVDFGNDRVQRWTMMGDHITSVGSRGSGPLQFENPTGIALHPSGRIFIADSKNNRIHILNSDLSYSHKIGSEGSAPGQFLDPRDVACDGTGSVYIADYGNNRVQKLTADGAFVCNIGNGKSQEVQLERPIAIAVDHTGRVYVTEGWKHHVSVFTSEGDFVYCFGSHGNQPGYFNETNGLALDHNGHLYVCDYLNKRVVVY